MIFRIRAHVEEAVSTAPVAALVASRSVVFSIRAGNGR